MTGKIESDGALYGLLKAAETEAAASKGAQAWFAVLSAFLAEVAAAVPARLEEPAFLWRLWDDNPVAATGMGSVRMAPALDDAGFRGWFASRVTAPLSAEPMAREAILTELYDELQDRLKALCGRTPRLKINRVLCALYPGQFTSVADVGKLLVLHREMGGDPQRPSCPRARRDPGPDRLVAGKRCGRSRPGAADLSSVDAL